MSPMPPGSSGARASGARPSARSVPRELARGRIGRVAQSPVGPTSFARQGSWLLPVVSACDDRLSILCPQEAPNAVFFSIR